MLASVAMVAPLAIAAPASAAPVFSGPGNPGDLDGSFGGDPSSGIAPGLVAHHPTAGVPNHRIEAIALQPDGKIVAAGRSDGSGNGVMARYNADGSLDSSFGIGGVVTNTVIRKLEDVAVQPDGNIVVVGTDGGFSYIARYNADGSPDTSFDGDGLLAVFSEESEAELHGVQVLSDGKILAAGLLIDFDCCYRAGAVRVNPDGSFDTSFDGDGVMFGPPGLAFSLAVQPDGRFLLGGEDTDWEVARFNSDGSLDTSFDGDGLAAIPPVRARIQDLQIQPDGKIVAVGWNGPNPDSLGENVVLTRYNPDGSLDAGFDGDGTVVTKFGAVAADANGAALQPDGKIVIAGSSKAIPSVSGRDFLTARFNSDGSADTTFGNGGAVVTDFEGSRDQARAVAVQPDGRIVAAGQPIFEGVFSFGLARYMGDIKAVLCPGMAITNVIIGTGASETLTGTAGRDLILGMAGADTISGGSLPDCIYGGASKDTVSGGAGKDRIFIAAGDVKAGKAETISGNTETDTLVLGVGIGTANVFGSPPNFTVVDPVTAGSYAVTGVETIVDTP